MFDAGMTEMMVIAVIALLVVGPERLPEVAAKVGGWIGKAKAFVSSTKADIEREFQASEMKNILSEQQQEIEELRKMVSSTQDDMKSSIDDAKDIFENKIHSSVDDVKSLDQTEESERTAKSEAKKND
ncbi:MAG TPA: twin-arginine translocase subunit TatB [Leucothrix mucor]|nr:twin-arginine translocase subunit TatB [Leucothrix mucor]